MITICNNDSLLGEITMRELKEVEADITEVSEKRTKLITERDRSYFVGK